MRRVSGVVLLPSVWQPLSVNDTWYGGELVCYHVLCTCTARVLHVYCTCCARVLHVVCTCHFGVLLCFLSLLDPHYCAFWIIWSEAFVTIPCIDITCSLNHEISEWYSPKVVEFWADFEESEKQRVITSFIRTGYILPQHSHLFPTLIKGIWRVRTPQLVESYSQPSNYFIRYYHNDANNPNIISDYF